jgi:hypothetical protein
MLLTFVMAMFGYALMLIVMTYIVVFPFCHGFRVDPQGYFFAVCLGLALGEFVFGRFYPSSPCAVGH